MDQFTKTIKWETYYQDPAEGHADTDVLTVADTCPRCGGKGTIDAYRHVVGGVCFECEGRPAEPYTITAKALRAKERKRAQGIASRERAAARKQAERVARMEQAGTTWAAAFPAMIHFADVPASNLTEWETSTLNSIRDSARHGDISDNQAALAARIIQAGIDRAEAPEVKKPTAPMGKHEVTGTITKMTVKESHWGLTVKITVTTAEGWKVYATCPKAIRDAIPDDLEGTKVAFTANLEPSNSEDLAFASRPTKARVL